MTVLDLPHGYITRVAFLLFIVATFVINAS